ncbi:putative methyltransferase family protein [Actinidia rufa]|uniref:Putative methyltransferase family protein n=1 Tax=Actinidia rufa TaxID=165716 RepID=A0A7J0FZN8_9ERIC|nr:putative methyltransferase family protein [Actinidia rufa]
MDDSPSFSPPQRAPTPLPPPLETQSEEDVVMSEVHLGCPPNFSGPHISRFTFSLPPEVEPVGCKYTDAVKDEATSTSQVTLDEDGDLVITRRSSLVGMLLAREAKTVFLTDHGDEVLENCAANVRLNLEMFHSQASVHVRDLNWNDSWPTKVVENSASQERYGWTREEVEELQRAALIVAADVIYSDDLTDAFFNTLEKLMMQRPEKVAYLALEKRYNFTFDDLNVVANGYSRFRSYLRDGEGDGVESGSLTCFVGKCIDLTEIPLYMREYDRGNDVEIWQIKYEKRKPHLSSAYLD